MATELFYATMLVLKWLLVLTVAFVIAFLRLVVPALGRGVIALGDNLSRRGRPPRLSSGDGLGTQRSHRSREAQASRHEPQGSLFEELFR